MKYFVLKFVTHCFIFIVVLQIISTIFLSSPNFISLKYSWYWIYMRLLMSSGTDDDDTIFVGDSVGGQLFSLRGGKNHLTTNGSVYIVGHYILAQKAYSNNNKINTIYIVSAPNIIGHNFERNQTYNNLILPFFDFENIKYFDGYILKKMSNKPLSFLAIFNWYKILPLSDIDFDNRKPRSIDVLSDFSIYYLKKFQEFSKKNNIRLKLISPPIPEKYISSTNNWGKMRKQVKEYKLEDIFTGYFDNIIYLPEECFEDDLHLNDDYLRIHKDEIVNRIIP